MPTLRQALLPAVTLLPGLALAQFGAQLVNGRLQLLGNSFGLLGANATFDYVTRVEIVGGGTAGLTIAKRLTEDPSVSVAVIEAGGYAEISNGNHSQVPAYEFYASLPQPTDLQPLVDYDILTVPQTQLDGQSLHYSQGKCIGGSSVRNYLAYQRGTNGSFHQWAQLVQDPSFEFGSLMPFFQKSVAFSPPNYTKRGGPKVQYDPNAFSPSGGPLQVSYQNYYEPFSDGIKKGFSSSGLKEIDGLNSGTLMGFAEFTLTIDPTLATRSSSETAFLQAALANQTLSKSTLVVYQQTTAQRILFDANKTATSVQVSTAGVNYSLSANKEIIVTAGAFRSPQMLLVSGIGPSQTLNGLDIPVVADLAGVGRNLLDQPMLSLSWEVNIGTNTRLGNNATFAAESLEQYLNQQKGPLAGPGGNYVGWEKLPAAYRQNFTSQAKQALDAFPSDWPELEIISSALTVVPTNGTANYASLNGALVAPTSRGNVTINSTDTAVNPLVNPNWLLNDTDQQVAVASVQRLRQIFNATGLALGELVPGDKVQTYDQILSYLKKNIATVHHAAGTCKMGVPSDPMAVVDTAGRVLGGVKRLRVMDASVFPLLPPGHSQSTVYMLAEKFAQGLRDEYHK